MKQKDELFEFYNKDNITEISGKGFYDEKIEFYLENFEKLATKSNNLKIIDVACNNGDIALKFKSYGEVIGIDINKDAVRQCNKKGIRCLNLDISGAAKLYSNKFDVVVAGDIIEHVFNTDEFLTKAHNLLKRNGTLLLTTANIASIGRRIMLLFGKNPYTEFSTLLPNKEYNVGHIRYYTVKDMYDQLKMIGYKNIRIFGDRINLFPGMSIPRGIAKNFPTLSRYMHVVAEK